VSDTEVSAPAATPEQLVPQDPAAVAEAERIQGTADKLIFSGLACLGMGFLMPIGAALFVTGLVKTKRAERRNLPVRPFLVTLIAAVMLADSFGNYLGWGLDVFASNSFLGRYSMMGWGALVDGGYFWQYNNSPLGGTSFPGEKSFEYGCIFVLYPIRIAACIALFKMKRWGFQWLIVSCWLSVFWLVPYMLNFTIYHQRLENIAFPVAGIWVFGIVYFYPIFIMGWFYTTNKSLFRSGR
jgi:hypothetical protein